MSLLITSLLMSLIASLWVWMMGRKDPCGQPWLTSLCLGVLLILPALALLPKVKVAMPQAEHAVASTSSWGLAGILTIAWASVVLVMTLRLCLKHLILRRWLNDSEVADWEPLLTECAKMLGVVALPQLRMKKALTSPVVAGIFRPVIILPASSMHWGHETRKMAILHELGHVQRKDLWFRLAAEFSCVLHWYNPLVWWLRSKLLTQCEYACDALVISAGADRKSYISALCDVVESAQVESRPQGLMAMADHAPLKLRVNRLLGGARVGKPWLAITAAILTTATALGLSLVRPAELTKPVGEDYSQEEIDLRHSANPFPGE